MRVSLFFSLVLAALLALTTLTGCQAAPGQDLQRQPAKGSTPNTAPLEQTPFPTPLLVAQASIVRVVDGDTVVVQTVAGEHQPTNVSGSQYTVRLLGIDAAEMNSGKGEPDCGAEAATDRLAELLPTGIEVTITYDAHADRTDRYGRSLAYVAVASSGEDVNLSLITGGYAEAWIPRGEPQPERWQVYVSAAEQAKGQRRGSYGAPENCTALGRP